MIDCPVHAFEGCACVGRCKNTPVIDLTKPTPNPYTLAARVWLFVTIVSIFSAGAIFGSYALDRQAKAYQEDLQ